MVFCYGIPKRLTQLDTIYPSYQYTIWVSERLCNLSKITQPRGRNGVGTHICLISSTCSFHCTGQIFLLWFFLGLSKMHFFTSSLQAERVGEGHGTKPVLHSRAGTLSRACKICTVGSPLLGCCPCSCGKLKELFVHAILSSTSSWSLEAVTFGERKKNAKYSKNSELSEKSTLDQGAASFMCEESNSKYFRLCLSHRLQGNYSTLSQ